jgi:hypothetical protein
VISDPFRSALSVFFTILNNSLDMLQKYSISIFYGSTISNNSPSDIPMFLIQFLRIANNLNLHYIQIRILENSPSAIPCIHLSVIIYLQYKNLYFLLDLLSILNHVFSKLDTIYLNKLQFPRTNSSIIL